MCGLTHHTSPTSNWTTLWFSMMCELGGGGSLGKTRVNAAVKFFCQLQTNLWNAKAISLLCFCCLQFTFCFHSANLSPIINASVAPVLSWPYYIWKEHSSSLLCEMKEMLIILSRERKLSAAMFPCAEYSCMDWTAIWSQTRVGVMKSTAGRQLSYFWRRKKPGQNINRHVSASCWTGA